MKKDSTEINQDNFVTTDSRMKKIVAWMDIFSEFECNPSLMATHAIAHYLCVGILEEIEEYLPEGVPMELIEVIALTRAAEFVNFILDDEQALAGFSVEAVNMKKKYSMDDIRDFVDHNYFPLHAYKELGHWIDDVIFPELDRAASTDGKARYWDIYLRLLEVDGLTEDLHLDMDITMEE